MELIKLSFLDENKFELFDEQIVAIGKFDGVHLGHHILVDKLLELGKELGKKTAILTFLPSPEVFFKKDDVGGLLTPLNDKMFYLKELGIDYLYVLKFDENISNMTYRRFYHAFLKPFWGIVCGKDFRFGKDRLGSSQDLLELKPHTYIMPQLKIDNVRVSSEIIKRKLLQGDMQQANKLLAKPFKFKGKIVTGMGLGKKLGIPTANLIIDKEYATLKLGVYVCFAKIEKNTYFGIMNYGLSPTFTDGKNLKVEIHFLDYVGDIYNKNLEVKVVGFLRDEKKFSSKEEFKNQLKSDIEEVRKKWSSS